MKNWLRMAILSVFLLFYTLQPSWGGTPGISGALSIIPGLGQLKNGDWLEAPIWFGAVVGSVVFVKDSDVQQAGFDLWQYNMYDAYRDAGPASKRYQNKNVLSNYLSFVNPLNLWDPIGASYVALGAASGYKLGYPALKKVKTLATYGFVGLGEEGLFRGFLFPAFTDLFFDSLWVGATTSSLAFAAFHGINGAQDLTFSPMIQRFIFGMFFCWMTHRERYDLSHGIFAHAWYDIFLDPGDGSKIKGIKMTIPF